MTVVGTLRVRFTGYASVYISPRLAPYHHHERWDGTGYPLGLRGEAIPLGARLFAVADALDAMTFDRPNSRAISCEAARDEIRRSARTHFDPWSSIPFSGFGWNCSPRSGGAAPIRPSRPSWGRGAAIRSRAPRGRARGRRCGGRAGPGTASTAASVSLLPWSGPRGMIDRCRARSGCAGSTAGRSRGGSPPSGASRSPPGIVAPARARPSPTGTRLRSG